MGGKHDESHYERKARQNARRMEDRTERAKDARVDISQREGRNETHVNRYLKYNLKRGNLLIP